MGLRTKVVIVASAVALTAGMGGVARAQTPVDGVLAAPSTDPAIVGSWTPPFVEGGDVNPGDWCKPQTAPEPDGETQTPGAADAVTGGRNFDCIPTAGSMAILGPDDVVYWDALEDMEEVETSVVTEFGKVSVNDQSRRMTFGLGGWHWSKPEPHNDGGATADTHPLTPIASDEKYNDGALFCAALTFLPDGRVLAVGGTAYYQDPSVPGTKYGVAELEGLDNARIYDPTDGSWHPAGEMTWGRWYPTAVPLPDGRVFVASGVTKLIKPLYTDDRSPLDSGRNVVQTETYTPGATGAPGAWNENEGGDRSLPLFPRLHLIPGGRVYFNSAGQVFNPMGQAYDELTWNLSAFYDPTTKKWTDGGIPGLGTPAPGFRGSTFSVMLPLEKENGAYTQARFLTAGGIIGTTPGTYFAVPDSRIDTVTSNSTAVTSESTGRLNQPRWYGTGVLTPTGEVIVFSGASADEVDGPGTAIPVTTPEIFDPKTKTWSMLAPAKEQRTYHNTAALLPDGRILVGGHAPIGTLYGPPKTLVADPTTGHAITSPQETRNPTFEIYSPPYLNRPGARPQILGAPVTASPGKQLTFTIDGNYPIDSIMLMRRTAITHLVDGGQRAVKLDVVSRTGSSVTVAMPPDSSIVPPGPYLLFVNKHTDAGPVPSTGWGVNVKDVVAPDPATYTAAPAASPQSAVKDLAAAGAVPVDAELAFHEIGHSHLPAPAPSGGHDIPWPVWPALAAVLATGLWTLRRRTAGNVATTR